MVIAPATTPKAPRTPSKVAKSTNSTPIAAKLQL
jgi:hypothetical protein